MVRVGLVVALVVIAIGAWFDLSYRSIRTEIADINSRLPSEEALDKMPLEETTEQLKLATISCDRVGSLRSKLIARAFWKNQIEGLAEHCELIKARQDALAGP